MDNLHRHPDYAPVKKEPIPSTDGPKDINSNNDDLPPPPPETPNADVLPLDLDGEFGSRFM